MKKKVEYFFYKIISSIFLLYIKKNELYPGLFILNKPKKTKRLIFNFNDKNFFHLGDQLFFAPTIVSLKRSGFNIQVNAPENLELFWKINGIKINTFNGIYNNEEDLLITYAPLYLKKKYKCPTLIIDFTNHNIDKKISDYFYDKLISIINLNHMIKSELNFPEIISKDINNKIKKLGENVWIYNNEIDSGFFRKSRKSDKKLYEKIIDLYNNGSKIIFLGKSVNKNYFNADNYISLDLRGQTTPDDIFSILNMDSIKGVISYDNFIMHVCLLLKKKPYIRFRGRFLKKKENHHLEYVNNTFENNPNQKIDYL